MMYPVLLQYFAKQDPSCLWPVNKNVYLYFVVKTAQISERDGGDWALYTLSRDYKVCSN